MAKFYIHANSIRHVTHLLEVEADSEEEALDAYWDDGQGELIGTQIHDEVQFMEPAPDEAHTKIHGIYTPVK